MNTSHTGIIKCFNNNMGKGSGFGFIAQPNGEDIFVHRNGIVGAGEKNLFPGDQVSFEIEYDRQDRPRAKNVRVQIRAPQPTPRNLHD
jgi:CspA family cold shock protein